MSTTARDPWTDAWRAATQPVLDPELVAVRRRIWVRQALLLVVGCGVVLALCFGLTLLAPDLDTVWPVSRRMTRGGIALAGLGLLLVVVANVRGSLKGLDRSLVGPDSYLPPTDRAWVREQVAQGRAVPADRRYVVIALARRMRAEGVQSLASVGLVCCYVGLAPVVPDLAPGVLFIGMALWSAVRVVRALLWSGRARRWLARHA